MSAFPGHVLAGSFGTQLRSQATCLGGRIVSLVSSVAVGCAAATRPRHRAALTNMQVARTCVDTDSLVGSVGSLNGRRILVTAPAAYAERLAAELRVLDAEVVRCPTIQTQLLVREEALGFGMKPKEFERSEELCAALESTTRRICSGHYSDVYFCSRRAVESFLHLSPAVQEAQRIVGYEIEPYHLGPVKLWALGADAQPLEDALNSGLLRSDSSLQFEVHRPAVSSTSGFVEEARRAAELQDPVFSCRAAVLAPLVEPPLVEPFVVPDLIEGLCEPWTMFPSGVDLVFAYRTMAAPLAEALVELDKTVDAICFSSILEAEALLQAWSPDLERAPRICCFGPSTALGVARALGERFADRLLVNTDFTSFAGFARTLAADLGPRL